jgi:hypothetical protein
MPRPCVVAAMAMATTRACTAPRRCLMVSPAGCATGVEEGGEAAGGGDLARGG